MLRCRQSLLAYSTEILRCDGRGYVPAAHHRLLIKKLMAVECGKVRRLIVELPPGSAKSTYASQFFPGWYMARNRSKNLVLASYGSELAEEHSYRAQRVVEEHGGLLGIGLATQAVSAWRTTLGNTLYAVGTGTGITGKRAGGVIIDDPVKGAKEANSPGIREDVWRWWVSDIYTRLDPGSWVIIMMTRWHQDDLVGRVREADPDGWDVVTIPAEAGENDILGRSPGEFLWSGDPHYNYAGDKLRLAKEHYRTSGAMREWEALFQQNPLPGEGALFKAEHIAVLPAAPAGGRSVRAWDLAATFAGGGRDPDWTRGVRMRVTAEKRYVVEDVVSLRGGPDEVEDLILRTARADGAGVPVRLAQDPGQAGKVQTMSLVRKLAGYRVFAVRETGDKATRAGPFASQVNVGNVAMVAGAWNREYREELGAFPSGKHDDMVDASSGAFAALLGPGEPPRRLHLPFMGR
jgi:predicted phage terminase large subunit-like protein